MQVSLQDSKKKAIGADSGIVETTVKIHVQHVLRKLAVSTCVQAAVLATSAGVS
ncbi:MAG: LuxR C-terminal-related transcriptional regulator [Hylemonella sp.]